VNPLDLTGFVMTKAELTEEVFEKYAGVVDTLVLAWWAGAGDEGWSKTLLEPFANVAARCDIPFVVTPLEATTLGPWVDDWRARKLLFSRGVPSLYRAVDALDRFVSAPVRAAVAGVAPDATVSPPTLIDSVAGKIVGFADAMALLTEAGVPVAPYVVLVVKLADVPHRTELGAVRLGVAPSDVAAAVAELRAIAAVEGVPDRVAVQAMVAGYGEAFGGLHCTTDLGPVVLLGIGGVLVEAAGKVGGRMLPVDGETAHDLAQEVAGAEVFAKLRGQRPWPVAAVADIVLGLDRLWRRHGAWLGSVDVNPLIVTDAGIIAVDALMVAR
jgi:acetate---CoA ligase (ADP-forming)